MTRRRGFVAHAPLLAPYRDDGRGSAARSAQRIVGDMELRTLEDIVRRPDMTIVEVIVQDEYTHDVVVAEGGRFLVFDAT